MKSSSWPAIDSLKDGINSGMYDTKNTVGSVSLKGSFTLGPRKAEDDRMPLRSFLCERALFV